MFGNTFAQVRVMRPSLRALIFLLWIYAFTSSMVGVFTQLFLYQKFTNLELNIIATIIYYTGMMVGFCVPGFVASVWRLNIKHGFLLGFILMAFALVFLLHSAGMSGAYVAMFFWGVGQGVFWLTVDTFELFEVKDNERDFYSSVLAAGSQVLSIVGPASAALLLWVSSTVLHLGTFTLLFTIAPAVYLLGFFSFSKIREYRPGRVTAADVTHFLTDKKNQFAQLYTLGTGIQQMLGVMVPPLVVLAILGTPLRVGVYNVYFALFSAICVLAIANYRTSTNRLAIFGLTTAGLAMVTLFFGYEFSFFALIIYTIVEGVLSPINSVSMHVTDLESMNIGREGSDFYATMLMRDFLLWIWRSAGGLALLFAMRLVHIPQATLSVGLYFLAISFILTYLGAFFLIRKMHIAAT